MCNLRTCLLAGMVTKQLVTRAIWARALPKVFIAAA